MPKSGEHFFKELNILCDKFKWVIIIVVNILGLTSETLTYVNQACGSKSCLHN